MDADPTARRDGDRRCCAGCGHTRPDRPSSPAPPASSVAQGAPSPRAMRFVLALALLLSATGVASANVSHAGWPERTGVLWIAPDSNSRNTGTDRNDELLGGDGSDRVHGGAGHDVIWGDKNPS